MQIGNLAAYTGTVNLSDIQGAARLAQPGSPATPQQATAKNPNASSSAAPNATGDSATSTAKKTQAGVSSLATGATASQVETYAASYSTTVGGKNYTGSVDEDSGQYTATVSSLIGATVTASSVQSAENSLTMRVDELA